jgi:hypothetical protein
MIDNVASRLVQHSVHHTEHVQVRRGDPQRSRQAGRHAAVVIQDRRACLWTDHREHRTAQHQEPVRVHQCHRTAAATLTDAHGHDGHRQTRHRDQGPGDLAGNPIGLRGGAGFGARRVDEGEDRKSESFGESERALGQPEGSGPRPRCRIAEGVPVHRDHDSALAADHGQAGPHRRVRTADLHPAVSQPGGPLKSGRPIVAAGSQ